jgi:hypothetical protein
VTGDLGKGAAVGGAAGSVIPGLGNAVGGAIGGAVGGIVGGVRSIFGGGNDEDNIRKVLPVLLKQIMDANGVQSRHAHGGKPSSGARGLKITGKAYKKEAMMNTVQELNQGIGDSSDTHDQDDVRDYNTILKITDSPPSNKNKIIVSFPVKTSSEQAVEKAKSNPPAKTQKTANASGTVYAIGAIAAIAYALR